MDIVAKGLPSLPSFPLQPKFPLWVIRLLTIFPLSGFLGLDHFALGSTYSGAAKAFANVIIPGSWYFHDMCEVLDGKKVIREGFDAPFIEGFHFGRGSIVKGTEKGMEGIVSVWTNGIVAAILGTVALIVFTIKGMAGSETLLSKVLNAVFWVAAIMTVLMVVKTGFSIAKPLGVAVGTLAAGAAGVGAGILPPLDSLKKVVGVAAGAASGATVGTVAPAANAEDTENSANATNATNAEDATNTSEKTSNIVQSGGAVITLSTIARQVLESQEGGRQAPTIDYESAIFIGILGTLAIGGIAYAVFRYKQQTKEKKNE